MAKHNASPDETPTRWIPVYSASGYRMAVTFLSFEAAEDFQRTLIAELTPSLLTEYLGICRDEHPEKLGRPMFKAPSTANRTNQ